MCPMWAFSTVQSGCGPTPSFILARRMRLASPVGGNGIDCRRDIFLMFAKWPEKTVPEHHVPGGDQYKFASPQSGHMKQDPRRRRVYEE
jgi:hypothetical protein